MEAEAERAYWGPGGVSAGLHALQLSWFSGTSSNMKDQLSEDLE